MPSAPRPRRFYLDSDDEWDEDYDVFLFYPSRNRVIGAGRQACYAPLANTITPYHQQCENPSWEWDDNDASSGVLEVRSLSLSSVTPCQRARQHFPSPTYSVDPDFVFPDDGHDGGIASMGYSKIFRSGLWAQVRSPSHPMTWSVSLIRKRRSVVMWYLWTAESVYLEDSGDAALPERRPHPAVVAAA